jgi:hypothetical protein
MDIFHITKKRLQQTGRNLSIQNILNQSLTTSYFFTLYFFFFSVSIVVSYRINNIQREIENRVKHFYFWMIDLYFGHQMMSC